MITMKSQLLEVIKLGLHQCVEIVNFFLLMNSVDSLNCKTIVVVAKPFKLTIYILI